MISVLLKKQLSLDILKLIQHSPGSQKAMVGPGISARKNKEKSLNFSVQMKRTQNIHG